MSTQVYHGTPLTPRRALEAIMPGRSACISFYRPDDLEALLAICPQVMFRSWRLLLLDGGDACWQRMGRGRSGRLVASILSLVGADVVPSWSVGDHAGQSRRTISGQRRPAERLALWRQRGTGLAHGRTDLSPCSPVRAASEGLHRLDWRPEARTGGVRCLSARHGRSRSVNGKRLASVASATWRRGEGRLPIYRGRHVYPRAERASLRQSNGRALGRPVARAAGLCGQVGR